MVIHIKTKRFACLLPIVETLCISQRLVVVSVASRCDVGLFQLACAWIELVTAFLCLTKAKTNAILLHVIHALVGVGYHGLRLLLHLLHLVNHRLTLCRGKWLVFLRLLLGRCRTCRRCYCWLLLSRRWGSLLGCRCRLWRIHTLEVVHAAHVKPHALGLLVIPLAVFTVGKRRLKLCFTANIVALGFQFAVEPLDVVIIVYLCHYLLLLGGVLSLLPPRLLLGGVLSGTTRLA